jgi:type IV pilus assembly protein PilM
MATRVVGVDIGETAVRAVEVSGFETARPSITRYHEVPLPETAVRAGEVLEVGTVATALKRLWSSGGFSAKEVVLGMGGHRVFARDITVARQPLPRIRESLVFQVQDQLPVPVSDVLMDFYPIREVDGAQGPEISGLLVAGLKDVISANVNAALSAGLRPIHVDLIPFAVARAVAPVRAARGRDAIISVGASSTSVTVVSDGVPLFVRMLPNGGDDVTRGIAMRTQSAPAQAEQAKRALGMGSPMMRPEDRPIIEIIYEVVRELLMSIRNTITYYAQAHPDEPVQRLVLTGGGAQLGGFANALSELTHIPVTMAEAVSSSTLPKRRGERIGREALDAYTVAYGLALGSHA